MVQQRKLLIGGVLLVALSGALYAVLGPAGDERPAYVHVRWAPSVDPATREQLERAYGLTRPDPIPPRTYSYYLTDVSAGNIRRLIANPAVEDTDSIDRNTFQIVPWAERGPYVRRRTEAMDFAIRACLFAGVVAIALWMLRAWRGRRAGVMPSGAAHPTAAEPATVFGRRVDGTFLVILLGALLVRLWLATTAPYIHDEQNTSIPLSKSISFSPGHLNLPLRGENHGALPAYVVKASSTLFGTTPLAYRALHVLLGMCAIVMVYLLTNQAYGAIAARWSASLMAFNEYFLSFSSRATANTPYLFLMTAAVYAFSRFLAAERAVHLYLAAVAAGLAFYCKEHAVLLLPVFLAMLLGARHRRWLRGPHAYLAAAVFVLVIAPDVFWNLRADPDTAHVTYSGGYLGQATYSAHLKRVGGLGFSPYPAMFYAYGPVNRLVGIATGRAASDTTGEYHPVNLVIGLLLVGAVLMTTFGSVRSAESDPRRRFLLLLAWGVFVFFTLIRSGDPPYRLAPVNWVWVEVTLVPAVILAGARLAGLTGRWRTVAWIVSAVALMYSVDSLAWNPVD